ncbi:hypothetical protein JOM56_009002 [Amanita muscaria]
MARSTHWSLKSPFFPLGDTAAVCLTSELAPEQPADILLLGCGDTHNVLYTVYADLGAPSRNLDITCCDLEPAILARNVLLFTLIADMPSESESDADEYISKMWNIYHHFFIDKGTFDFFLKHCQMLVDLSSDLASWDSSKYGTFLRFCTAHTLSALRKHWVLYIETENFSDAEKDSLLAKMPTKLDICKSTLRRSAGMLAGKLGRMGMRNFYRYWQRGTTFDDAEELPAANQINPTFIYSANGLGFDMHRSSDPLLSFHPAKVLAPVKDFDGTTVTVSTLVKSAMEEFAAWCRAFKERLKPQSSPLVIRFFTGDALAFCRALQYFSISNDSNTGIYASAWSSTLINFDGEDYTSRCAPLQFNVIDTSNLTDHLGLMNILIASRPLMRRDPSSVLHTNTLYRFNMIERAVGSGGFLNRLCGDISILSMVLDIVPVSYVSDFKTHSNNHEMYMEIEAGLHSVSPDAVFFIKQFYERIYWRICSISDSEIVELLSDTPRRLKFDEIQLATFLCDVYMDMFSEEKLVEKVVWESKELSDVRRYSRGQYYVRSSFVYLLRVIRGQLHIDWESFKDHLDDLIINDCKLHVFGRTNIADYRCSLHLAGICTLEPLSATLSDYYKQDLFEGWDDIPPSVCITFMVPKEALSALEEFVDQNKLESLPLVCTLMGDKGPTSYCGDFQSFFANINVDYSTPEPIITINEDTKGIHGSSPIIFSFYIETEMLVHCPSVAVTPQINLDSPALGHVLGPRFAIFSVEITDRNHVHITRERPGNQGELQKLRAVSNAQLASSTTLPLSDCVKINLDNTGRKVETLTGRVSTVEAALPANDAAVLVHQTSTQAMSVSFGSNHQVIAYPFPVDSTGCKTRISRESSYVEVDVKILCPEQELGMPLKPFPLIKYRGLVSLWNIHYLDLDQLPVIDLSRKREFGFLPVHIRIVNSDNEIRLRTTGPLLQRKYDVIGRMKPHISDLFIRSCKAPDRRSRVFVLAGLIDGIHALIFINDVRLDLASHTVVADAMALHLTPSIVRTLARPLKQLRKNKQTMVIVQWDDWRHILPAFAERCRKWNHTAHCEYLTMGVPGSQELTETLLCGCGKGKDLGQFEQEQHWKPFVPHSTRVAISQLFGVSFSSSVGGDCLESLTKMHFPSNICCNCGSSGFVTGKDKLYLCGACNIAAYCSRECQKAHWERHKKKCKKDKWMF